MSKFDLNKFNAEKIKLGEQPLKLKKTTYKKPKIKNGMLVQARIINREVSYFRYFLEKINILDWYILNI